MKRVLVLVVAACGGGGTEDIVGGDAAPSDAAKADAKPVDARPPDPPPPPPPPDAAPPPAGLRVFVTSLRYSADLRTAGGKPTARASADSICQTLADAAGVTGTFRAWLSTTDVHAIDHIAGAGPWYRMDGAVAFPNRASLGTTPLVPIMIDEQGGMPDPFYEAWTGTAVGGYLAPLDGKQSVTCWDWTSTIDSTQVGGVVGDIDNDGPNWTDLATGYCSPFKRRLYCFEQ